MSINLMDYMKTLAQEKFGLGIEELNSETIEEFMDKSRQIIKENADENN